MSGGLSWRRENGRIVVSGRIDENADLGTLASEIGPEGATLDLGGVTRLNSIGVREWMDFIAAVRDRPLTLERCPPVVVDQLNAIANFVGDADLRSVLVAYECESDGETAVVQVNTEDARADKVPVPPRCPRCGAETVPSQEHDVYFRFLRYKD